MKRLTLSKVCIAAAVVLLILIGQAQQTKTPKRPYEHLLKFSKTQSQKQSQPEKKKNSCQESESIISAFVKELPNKLSTDEKEVTKIRTKILQNESLKKIIIKNNQCGANAASRLANIYSHFGLSDKANEYHKIVLNFAEKDNTTAIANLCGYDAISTKEQKLHYCKIVTNRKNIDFKSAALFFLGQHYLDNNDGDNLIELCLKNTEDKDLCQNLYLFPLGEKLRKEKKYKQAIKYYEKIEPVDVNGHGFVDYQLGEAYVQGEGTKPNYSLAIFWYEKALKKNYNEGLRSLIINNVGAAHEMQSNYVIAFNYYKQAAIMGYALGQLNVAKQYIRGHGTIQDYTQAYAWLTISIAQGLDGNRQSDAEKLKDALTYELSKQDKTGAALARAKKLAQVYYKQYVLHEKIVTKAEKKKSMSTKIRKAISVLSE